MIMNKYVRFFNADCMGREITFYIDGVMTSENLAFGKFSDFIKIENSETNFTISCDGCEEKDCSSLYVSFDNSPVYTVAAVCIGGEVCLYGIREMFDNKDRNNANLRVCNLSPDVAGNDLYANRFKVIGDMEYLEVSKYVRIVPDTYDFTVRDGKDIKFNIGNQTLKQGKYNTFYIIGKLKSIPDMKCIVSVDAMSYESDAL